MPNLESSQQALEEIRQALFVDTPNPESPQDEFVEQREETMDDIRVYAGKMRSETDRRNAIKKEEEANIANIRDEEERKIERKKYEEQERIRMRLLAQEARIAQLDPDERQKLELELETD